MREVEFQLRLDEIRQKNESQAHQVTVINEEQDAKEAEMQHFKEKTIADIEQDFLNDQDKFESAEAHELLAQKKIQEKN